MSDLGMKNVESSEQRTLWHTILAFGSVAVKLAIAWILLKIIGCAASLEGPVGPRVGGALPNGDEVWFESYPIGQDTNDYLVYSSAGSITRFLIDEGQYEFNYVYLKYSGQGEKVWVESSGRLIASFDSDQGDFRGVDCRMEDWAGGDGKLLSEGRTYSMLHILGPW